MFASTYQYNLLDHHSSKDQPERDEILQIEKPSPALASKTICIFSVLLSFSFAINMLFLGQLQSMRGLLDAQSYGMRNKALQISGHS